METLAQTITKDFLTEKEKARAIYVWVADNIAYDVAKYAERSHAMNVILKKKDESQSAEKILKKRKAVCEGYSNLVKELCNKSGIICEMIDGISYVQKKHYELHAWNVVKIDGEWKLLDATWSAGGIVLNKNSFQKKFDDQWFFQSPDKFIKTHYPFDPMWQLLSKPLMRNEFEPPKTVSRDAPDFNFNDTIAFHFQQDSISQFIATNRRTFEFDPGNNLAEQNLINLLNYSENEKMNHANEFARTGIKQYGECIKIVNDAKRSRSTKKMNTNEEKLKQLINDSRGNIQKSLDLYRQINFSDNSNAQVLKMNIKNCEDNLKEISEFEKYTEKYFKTPKAMRISAL
ncbi:MAG: transglutaminase domain-containing protein [Bacteroidia bacterium]